MLDVKNAERNGVRQKKKTKDFFKLKKLKGRYKRKKKMLTLSPSSPTLAGTSSLPLLSLTTLLLHSLSTTHRLLLSLATTPDLLGGHWSSGVAARGARCSVLGARWWCSVLGVAARSHRLSPFPSSPSLAATPDLLGCCWSVVAARCSVVLLAARWYCSSLCIDHVLTCRKFAIPQPL